MRGTRNLTEARAIYIDETHVVVDAEGKETKAFEFSRMVLKLEAPEWWMPEG